MRALKEYFDRHGLGGLRKLVTARGAALRVRQLGTDLFHIRYGQSHWGQGDGGEWEVRYRPDGTLEQVSDGVFFRT